MQLRVWDVGDGLRPRNMWRNVSPGVRAVLFVVDASDRERLEEASLMLRCLLREPVLAGACWIVLGNKEDVDGAVSAPVDTLSAILAGGGCN